MHKELKVIEQEERQSEIKYKKYVDGLEKEQEKLFDDNQRMTIALSNKQYDLREHTQILEKLTTKVKSLESNLTREKTILNGKLKELDTIRKSITTRYPTEKRSLPYMKGGMGGGSGSTPLLSPQQS